MLLDPWSIGLLSVAAFSLFLATIGAGSAIRVLSSWDIQSDSEVQIRLEEQVWLTAAVVQFGLVLQVVGIVLLVLAADHFSTMLKGAMCATGALTANVFGLPALACRLAAMLLSVCWLVLHRLDVSSESYPLVRQKAILLLFLLPLLVTDGLLVSLYLASLDPDIVTSCCGVLLSQQSGDGFNLLGPMDSGTHLILYGAVIFCICGSTLVSARITKPTRRLVLLDGLSLIGWLLFYLLSLVVITVDVSPYVYAMPHHRCPFDLIQYPYSWIGYPLYISLHAALFAGLASSLAGLARTLPGLSRQARRTKLVAARTSVLLLAVFLFLAALKPLLYIFGGGQ